MTEDAQIRVRLIVDDQARPRSALARQGSRGMGATMDTRTPHGERTPSEQAEREGKIRKAREKPPSKDDGITGAPGRLAGIARGTTQRLGQTLFPRTGGGGATAATVAGAGRVAGGAVGRAAVGGAAVVGALEFTRTVVPMINAAVSEVVGQALHIPGVGDVPIFDKISDWISDVFNTVGSALPVAGETMQLARTIARAGGHITAEQLGGEYSRRLGIAREMKGLRDSFNREINQDVARNLVRMAMGREGD